MYGLRRIAIEIGPCFFGIHWGVGDRWADPSNPPLPTSTAYLDQLVNSMDWFQKGLEAAKQQALEASEKARELASQASVQARLYAEQASEKAKVSTAPPLCRISETFLREDRRVVFGARGRLGA